MIPMVTDTHRDRALILADALSETVAELRLIDPGDLIGYIKARQWANIADLVHSSAELSFHEGALLFGCYADFALDWATPPSISFELEFFSDAVSAFFTLFLDKSDALVELRQLWFANEPNTDDAGTCLLKQAIVQARLPSAAWPRRDGRS